MKIYQISNNINFCANKRFVYNDDKLLYKTTTYFFREDTDWDNLNAYLCKKFKDTEKVNVITHACSNGMEPYSFIMHMMVFHPENARKFFPVLAKDIDKKNINIAETGLYELEDTDLYLLDYYTKGRYREYLYLCRPQNKLYSVACVPNETLKQFVQFKEGDIFEDIKTMPSKNTVLFCKNFWPYLEPQKQELLAKNLSEQFDSTCTIITGDYDAGKIKMQNLLGKYGFHAHPTLPYVYEKLK